MKSNVMPSIFYTFSSPGTKKFTNSPIDAVIQWLTEGDRLCSIQ